VKKSRVKPAKQSNAKIARKK